MLKLFWEANPGTNWNGNEDIQSIYYGLMFDNGLLQEWQRIRQKM